MSAAFRNFNESDRDGSPPDPELQEAELRVVVREMGSIECDCRWTGPATEAVQTGAGTVRDLHCPECGRPLRRLFLDEEAAAHLEV
jgi:hypothetical protein